MPALRLVNSLMSFGLLGGLCLIWVQVRRPPIGGSASSNGVSGGVSPPSTALATLSAVSLYSKSVCYLIFPICVFSCFESLYIST